MPEPAESVPEPAGSVPEPAGVAPDGGVRPWYKARAVWVPGCVALIGVGVAVVARRCGLRHPLRPAARRAKPPVVMQFGVVNIYSRPDVHRPAVGPRPRPKG